MPENDARNRLREAALELFGRDGIQATSTRDILAAAEMRNPSGITYHFGSKRELIDDLVAEFVLVAAPVLQQQVELEAAGPVSPEQWVQLPVDLATSLISTERGCLLVRVWWEYDGFVHPDALEEMVASDHPLAVTWRDAAARTFDHVDFAVAVGRNIIMLRTLQFMTARRARRTLTGRPIPAFRMNDRNAFGRLMYETALGIVSPPTDLTDADVEFG